MRFLKDVDPSPTRRLLSAGFLLLAAASPLCAQSERRSSPLPELGEVMEKASPAPMPRAHRPGATWQAEAPPAQAPRNGAFSFSPKDCDFPWFKSRPGDPQCQEIPYSPEACLKHEHAWFKGQVLADSGKICLGFQSPPPGKTCADDPENIDCFLEENPGACNYLTFPSWTPCINGLFMECIEHGDLGAGRPLWLTPASKIPHPPSNYIAASEMCHWYASTNHWPLRGDRSSRADQKRP